METGCKSSLVDDVGGLLRGDPLHSGVTLEMLPQGEPLPECVVLRTVANGAERRRQVGTHVVASDVHLITETRTG